MKHIEVVAAVIHHEGDILCVQRGAHKYAYIAHKYEFPGGKVEDGESAREALNREIYEELKLYITVKQLLLTVNHQYPDFKVTMHCYCCESLTRSLTLTEHVRFQWLPPKALKKLNWAAADIPAVNLLSR